MRLVFTSSFVLLILALANASSYEKNFRSEKHPGKCVINGQVVSPGQSIKHPIMECAEFTCDNSNGMATIETCDPVSALASPLQLLKSYDPANRPQCTWGDFINTKADYPKCCERHFSCVL